MLIGGSGFTVTIQNVLCGSLGVTCSKSVTVSLLGPHVETITLVSDEGSERAMTYFQLIISQSCQLLGHLVLVAIK